MATYTAKWGPKGFLVSPKKIVPLRNLTTSFALKAEENNDTSGTPTTNTRGRELQSITLETTYMTAAGVNPRAQIKEWYELIGGTYPLYIGGERFGPELMQLEKVDVSNVILDDLGRFISVDLSISLKEYVPASTKASEKDPVASVSTSTSATTNSKTSTTKQTATESNKSAAMSAKPSTEEKAAKKYTPIRSKDVNK